MSMKLPEFSGAQVEGFLRGNQTNPHLLFYRYLNGTQSDQNATILKDKFLPKSDIKMLKAVRMRQEAALKQWKAQHPEGEVCSASFELMGRMVVGMGISSSFENGLLLDWVHGIPFINGEAVKGATRSFGWEQIGQSEDEAEKSQFQKIFGTLSKEETDPKRIFRGDVIFFNAYPETETDLFDVDMITCHYGPYYTGTPAEAPGDWHNPNPVAFLTIKEGAVFRFSVSSLEKALAEKAMEWLKDALLRRGMGAKKRVGYGHFIPTQSGGKNTESILGQSESALMMKIRTTQASKLPGMASALVDEIEAVSDPEGRLESGKGFWERLNPNIRKKNRNKEWMKRLEAIIGEEA